MITSRILPIDYQQLDYIESKGNQYIDTGVTANQNISIQVDGWMLTPHSLYGTTTGLNVTASSANVGGYFYYWNRNSTGAAGSSSEFRRCVYTQRKNKCFRNNKLVSSFPLQNFTDNQTIYLFCRHNYSTVDDIGRCRIYSCIIWDNDIMIRNMIPCYRIVDSEIGMYDLINNKF